MNNYPEHDKLAAIDSVQKEAVQDFIDWLYDETDLVICDSDYELNGAFYMTRKSREQIMAKYFGIDLRKLLSEQDRIFDDWREKQGL